MPNPIPLKEYGIRLFACRLFNHDYLWFSSFEISKLSATLPVLHNYALCYVFTFDGSVPKGLTRLGKKGTVFRIGSEELENPVAIFKEEPTRPTHLVNPLDISGNVIAYDPIMLPPHMLFRTAEIAEYWFVFSARHRVLVPGRVLGRA